MVAVDYAPGVAGYCPAGRHFAEMSAPGFVVVAEIDGENRQIAYGAVRHQIECRLTAVAAARFVKEEYERLACEVARGYPAAVGGADGEVRQFASRTVCVDDAQFLFGGESVRVRLEFADTLAGVVLDRFGKDVFLTPSEDGTFSFETEIVVSPQFYGWLFSFGKDARILRPQSVKDGFAQYLKQTAELYE